MATAGKRVIVDSGKRGRLASGKLARFNSSGECPVCCEPCIGLATQPDAESRCDNPLGSWVLTSYDQGWYFPTGWGGDPTCIYSWRYDLDANNYRVISLYWDPVNSIAQALYYTYKDGTDERTYWSNGSSVTIVSSTIVGYELLILDSGPPGPCVEYRVALG